MKFKKSISIAVICSFFFFAQSNRAEANPAVIVPGVIALGATLLVGATMKYSAPTTNYPNVMSQAATLGRLAVATFKVVNQYNVEVLQNKLVTLKANFNQLVDKAVAPYLNNGVLGSTPYPALSSALLTTTYGKLPNSVQVGQEVANGNRVYHIDSINYNYVGGTCDGSGGNLHAIEQPQFSETRFQFASGYQVCTNGVTGYSNYQMGNWSFVKTTPLVSKTAAQLVDERNTSTNQYNTPNVAADVDRLIADHPDTFTAVDTATPDTDLDQAPPFVPPANIIQPGQVITNNYPTSNAAAAASQAAQAKALAQATAQANVDAYKASHPGATAANDPTLASLEKALADATAASTAAANVASTTAAEADVPLPNADLEPPEKLNINSWMAMIGAFTNLGPYQLLTKIEEYLSQLIRPPEAPRFNLPLPLGNTMTIDLAPFDPIASLVRWCMSLFIAIGTILYAVRFWRGN